MVSDATKLLHADHHLKRENDIAPPINVANMYEYPKDSSKFSSFLIDDHVYSRESNPNTSRSEAILSSILGGYAVLYSNGVAAFHGAVLALNPKRIFVDHAYGGLKVMMTKFQQNGYMEILPLEAIEGKLQKGDLVHLETPMSPWGTALDLESWAQRVHAKGGILSVDATIGPPPILKPFDFGVDLIVHSGSKYFGGHSDVLSGVLVTKSEELKRQLIHERTEWGTILSSFDSWLLLRSLRTLNLRVKQQTSNAQIVVDYLSKNITKLSKVTKVYHTSLQSDAFIAKQFPNGGPATFSIEVTSEEIAKEIPGQLELFAHVTSMGGVESTIEWRLLSDKTISPKLLRLSIGIEEVDDLIEDLRKVLE